MPYKDGSWGDKAKNRSQKRKEYFRLYQSKKSHNYVPRENKVNLYKSKKYTDFPTFSRVGELEALKIFKGAIDKNYHTTGKYDIEWNGYKIDVKTSRLNLGKRCLRWKFLLKQQDVDYFCLVCFINESLEHILLIPRRILLYDNLSITKKSLLKYKQYIVK